MTGQAERQPKRIETIARGVLQCGGHVLLCQDRSGGYMYLPGGHVEPGESAAAALAREMEEEAGCTDVRVGECVLVTEQRFLQGQKAKHEVNLVFHVEHLRLASGEVVRLTGSSGSPSDDAAPLPLVESREDHIAFIWADAAAIADLDLRPASMKAWLMGGSKGLDAPAWISQAEW